MPADLSNFAHSLPLRKCAPVQSGKLVSSKTVSYNSLSVLSVGRVQWLATVIGYRDWVTKPYIFVCVQVRLREGIEPLSIAVCVYREGVGK